VRIPASGDGR
jgi:hypothetical protein